MFSTIGTDLTYSSMASPLDSSQDFAELSASGASFVPTVTAISSSPELQWMVQSVVSSVASSESSRHHPYSPDTSFSRTKTAKTVNSAGRRGKFELVSEEEEKKRLRRERNKMAAAKCRNRRRELTDTLQAETDKLEDEKSALQNDVSNLLKEKERLEFILAAHRPVCKIAPQVDSSFSEPSPASTQSTVTSRASTLTTSTSTTTVKLSDLDSTLEASLDLFSKSETDTARSVPDIDLSNSLYAAQDYWEPLYTPANLELEPLCTPVVTCTPACTSYTSSFVFSYPESDAFSSCGRLHRRQSSGNEQSSDSLNSPTLLTL